MKQKEPSDISRAEALEDEYEGWMRALPSDIRAQFVAAKVRAHMASMPDGTPIDADLAAVYLCVSPATLKRMRAEGTGPTYQQPRTNEGTTARNQKITYLMGELKRWLQEQSTSSTMHAAELRGTMFATLQDLTREHPFWIKKVGGVEAVLGHVLAIDVAGLISDPEAHIEWLDWIGALSLPWANATVRNIFEEPVLAAISVNLQEIASGNESTQLLVPGDQ